MLCNKRKYQDFAYLNNVYDLMYHNVKYNVNWTVDEEHTSITNYDIKPKIPQQSRSPTKQSILLITVTCRQDAYLMVWISIEFHIGSFWIKSYLGY
jgi:hypothetical protein